MRNRAELARRRARDAEDVRRATERRLSNPCASPGVEVFRRHVQVTDCLKSGGPVSCACTCYHCTLSICKVCGAYEGGLTTHCPGERVDYDTTQAVYTTALDFTTDRGWHLSDTGMKARSPVFERSGQ